MPQWNEKSRCKRTLAEVYSHDWCHLQARTGQTSRQDLRFAPSRPGEMVSRNKHSSSGLQTSLHIDKLCDLVQVTLPGRFFKEKTGIKSQACAKCSMRIRRDMKMHLQAGPGHMGQNLSGRWQAGIPAASQQPDPPPPHHRQSWSLRVGFQTQRCPAGKALSRPQVGKEQTQAN